MTLSVNNLRRVADGLGFLSLGAVSVDPPQELQARLERWFSCGRHGDMAWMARDPERRADPGRILDNARTIVSCALNYYTPHAQTDDPACGRIARYAWGDDYHGVMLPRLQKLAAVLHAQDPAAESLCYVDTGPVMEKPWAACAGLGWQGKHTNLIDPKRGSWFFIGEIVTTSFVGPVVRFPSALGSPMDARGLRAVKTANQPVLGGLRAPPAADVVTSSKCGTCTRCISICPTRAIFTPYQLDARRCISYLTIEHKGPIPLEMRPLMGNHIYGCDLCQDICPWNRFATPTPEPAFQPREGNLNPELIPLLYMTDDDFRTRFQNSPVKRIKRARFLRNVAVALGNSKDPTALPALRHATADPDPLIREHAEWAVSVISCFRS